MCSAGHPRLSTQRLYSLIENYHQWILFFHHKVDNHFSDEQGPFVTIHIHGLHWVKCFICSWCNTVLATGLGFCRPKPVSSDQNGKKNWVKPVLTSFFRPKLVKTGQNWPKLWTIWSKWLFPHILISPILYKHKIIEKTSIICNEAFQSSYNSFVKWIQCRNLTQYPL